MIYAPGWVDEMSAVDGFLVAIVRDGLRWPLVLAFLLIKVCWPVIYNDRFGQLAKN